MGLHHRLDRREAHHLAFDPFLGAAHHLSAVRPAVSIGGPMTTVTLPGA